MNIDWSAIPWSNVVTSAVAVGALVVSLVSVRHSRRAADAGETTAKATQDAVRAGELAAKAAQDSALEAATMARSDREREHDRLGPGPVPTIGTTLQENSRNAGLPRSLMGTIAGLQRDYRVQAMRLTDSSSSPIGLDVVLRAGSSHRFEVEQWPDGRTEPQTEYALLRFWPPVAGVDDAQAWSCPCDRPAEYGSAHGHWEWRAPVEPPLPEPWIFSA